LAQVGPNETAFADGGHSDGHTEPIPLVGTSANRAQAAHARHACRVADGTRVEGPQRAILGINREGEHDHAARSTAYSTT
jgi:hypothetical protein